MKSRALYLSVTVITLSLLALALGPTTAAAASISYQWRYSGQGADATWEHCHHDDHCGYTSVYVAENMYRSDGTKFEEITLSYYHSHFDSTSGLHHFSYGYLQNPTFTIDKRINNAAVSGDVPVQSCTYDELTGLETCEDGGVVSLSVSWNGTGPQVRGSSRGHTVSKEYVSNYNHKGTWREASATGIFNGHSMGPSNWANLFNYRDASVYVCHSC